MNPSQTQPASSGNSRLLPLLLLLLAGSGCAALIYEIVWYQLLQLAIGSTAVSLGVLLATFMGGLCIGSIGMGRLGSLRQHPLRVYGLIELGIGLCGVLVLFGLPVIDRIYIAGAGYGLPGMLLRAFIAAVCMLPPTILMGASLPAISRWIKATPSGASWWGFLYGANTAGAVFGCLLAGFYLLRLYDTATATYVAALINLVVALVSLAVASRAPLHAQAGGTAESSLASEPTAADFVEDSPWPVYITIGLSGACALGAEVIWTRLMSMMLGTTVYVFSIILAVFLVGLSIGTAGGSWLTRAVRPRMALGWCQILQTAGIAWAVCMITQSIPYWPVDAMLSTSPWYTFQLDMVRCLWAILPSAILWGASFPLALAAVASPGKDPGRLVGAVYAANTLGAIVGALATSLWLVPWIGTQQSQRLLLLLSAFSAVFVLAPQIWKQRTKSVVAVPVVLVLLAVGLLAWSIHPIPGEVVAYGRRIMLSTGQSEVLYQAEGRNSSVVITKWGDSTIEICVNGHVEATTTPFDMRLQRMVGHLPALLHPDPKSILGIGFGAGVSAGTFTRYAGIKKITICEIEPIIPSISTRFFGEQNYHVALDPRTHIVFDDARHFVMTTTEKFDIIASDPLDVFAKGTAALYSTEYFEAVKRHLNPGGIFTLYVPLYESDERTVRSELATFFEAFPYGTIWANTVEGRGYDMVFMGQAEPMKINVDALEAKLARPDYQEVAQSLREIGVFSPADLLATYAGQKADLGLWVKGSPLNRDRDLRLQYLAGWGIDNRQEDRIYREMMRYRQPPENLFVGSPALVASVLAAVAAEPR